MLCWVYPTSWVPRALPDPRATAGPGEDPRGRTPVLRAWLPVSTSPTPFQLVAPGGLGQVGLAGKPAEFPFPEPLTDEDVQHLQLVARAPGMVTWLTLGAPVS